MKRVHLVYLTVAVLAIAVLGLALRFAVRRPALAVSVAAASRGPIAREVLTSGVLEPKNSVDTGSQVSGTIQSLDADFNSTVKAGQVLAQIDPSVYDTKLAQARAAEIQAQADVLRLRGELDDLNTKAKRAVELASGDLITQAEVDAAELAAKEAAAALDSAVAETRVAAAGVREAEVNRARTTIRAPMDGLVVSRNVEVGQTIAASFSSPVLFRIADLRKMQLLTEVGESEAGEVQKGVPVSFQIESIGARKFTGVISDVRLEPIYEQAGSTGTSGGGSSASAVATNGASSSSSSRTTSGATSTAGTSTAQAASNGTTASAPAGSVVSYTAVVDVDNSDGSITPGSTAVVALPTARRADVLRVPNSALAFRPNPDMLKASGQSTLKIDTAAEGRGNGAETQGYVWKYEEGKFVPIEVETGAADERWTEVKAGSVEPGDQLVTQASTSRR